MSDQSLFQFANAQCARRELERIGDIVNVWRFSGECDRHFAHRISVALTESICDREALLDMVISLARIPPRRSTE
jgi:hypothetical protein